VKEGVAISPGFAGSQQQLLRLVELPGDQFEQRFIRQRRSRRSGAAAALALDPGL
jgi:hypothetical protein